MKKRFDFEDMFVKAVLALAIVVAILMAVCMVVSLYAAISGYDVRWIGTCCGCGQGA